MASSLWESESRDDSVDKTHRVRVTILASEWGSSKGGLSTINRELAIQLAKCPEVEVSFFLPQCSQDDKKLALKHNVKIIEAAPLPGFEQLDWLCFPPEDLQIDIIIGHGAKLGKQAQIIKRSKRCKWVQVVHTDPEELAMFKNNSDAISKGEEKHKTEIKLCEIADHVVGIGPKLSEAFRSYLRSCQKDDNVVDFTPGVFEEFAAVKQAPGERQQRSVLVFGRGDVEDFKLKGFDIAGKAVAKLEDTRLVFVGAPDGKHEEIANRLTECGVPACRLRVRGFLPDRKSLKHLFQEVDLVVMPSRTEGFGLTGLEALSAGLPVLVSRNSGFGETLCSVPFGSSSVINTEDPAEWTSAIKKVWAKDRKNRLEEAETLRYSYGRRYNWAKQINDLIEKMISWIQDDSSNVTSSSETTGRMFSSACKTSQPMEGMDEHRAAVLPILIDCEKMVPLGALCTSTRMEAQTARISSNSNQLETVVTAGLQMETREVVAPVESQVEVQGAAVVPGTSETPRAEFTSGRKRKNIENRAVHRSQEVLNLITSKYLKKVNPSTLEEFNGFVQYIERVRGALILDVTSGSLIVMVECSSLEILEGLWEDYSTGYLSEMAQKFLATDEVLKVFGLAEVKLTTTIKEEEYRVCHKLLSKITGPGQGGVKKGASDLPSVVSTEPCTSEQAYHDQAAVKEGIPSNNELEDLSVKVNDWEKLGRRLGFTPAELTALHQDKEKWSEKAFAMLLEWKQRKGSDATYRCLYDALCHKLINRKDLAEEFCCSCSRPEG